MTNAVAYHTESLGKNFTQFTPNPRGLMDKTPIGGLNIDCEWPEPAATAPEAEVAKMIIK
jgi:hypothetical protein